MDSNMAGKLHLQGQTCDSHRRFKFLEGDPRLGSKEPGRMAGEKFVFFPSRFEVRVTTVAETGLLLFYWEYKGSPCGLIHRAYDVALKVKHS